MSSRARTLRGAVAVAGIGETGYHKRGQSPDLEFVMALQAVLAACEDAGIDPHDIDGFASYADDRNQAIRLATALGCRELRFSNMQWGGGGAGGSAAVANAAAAVATGLAECVVVFRALAQGQFGRFGAGSSAPTVSGGGALTAPYGLMSAAHQFAMRMTRAMHDHGISPDTQKAVALASYHHAQQNPRAVMHGRPLTPEAYDESRWIVEPWHLYDCCMENDGAAALILVPADRAADLPHRPCYLLGAAQGAGFRDGAGHYAPTYASACFQTLAPRLWDMAGVGPDDVDVVQSYENFTGGVVLSLIEHGFCTYEDANEVLTFDNLVAPTGRLPLNTSGGNLAECYVHGFELQLEAVRQIRGTSPNQVPDVDVSFVSSGPLVVPASNLVFGSTEALG
jgi:acetyl-CoA acetyltransferase